MGKFTTAQNNFISGELSPRLEGRGDIQEYYNGVAKMENAIPARGGGCSKRPGTQFVRDLTGTLQEVGALYPMVISRDESYIIAITTKVPLSTLRAPIDVKVYRASFTGAQTLTSVTITNNYPTHNIVSTPYSDKKFNVVQIFDLMVFTHTSGTLRPFVIRKLPSGDFELNTYMDEVLALGSLIRGTVFPDYNRIVTDTATISAVGTVLTLSSAFISLAVGELIKIKASATLDYVYKVVTVTSPTVYGVIALTASADAVYSEWAHQSWSEAYGYPKSVTLFQQRIGFGGTAKYPTGVWFSNVENLFLILNKKLLQDSSTDVSGIDFFGPILSSDPFGVTLTSNQSNGIQWMTSDKVLQIGTTSTEYVISTIDGKFGPANVSISAQTFFGSSDSSAIRSQNATVFVSTDGKSLREISFSFENGSNVSRLLSVLADQIVYHDIDTSTSSVYDTEIEQMIYQPSRSCIWAITSQGSLIGVVIEESGKVLAWHRHIISGTSVKIHGMATIPDDLGRYDNLYLNVERSIDGVTSSYIEVIGPDFENDSMYGHYNGDLRNFPIYTDSFYTPSTFSHGATKADVPHLAGETVEVLEKGIYVGDRVVKTDLGGLPYIDVSAGLAAYDIIVGLSYKAKVKSLKIQKGSKTGTSEIQIKRIDTVIATLFRSYKYRIGTREDNTELVDKSSTDALQLFTGEHRTSIASSSDTDQRFYIESVGPYPLNILSIGSRGFTED